jgi:hypothetical protein
MKTTLIALLSLAGMLSVHAQTTTSGISGEEASSVVRLFNQGKQVAVSESALGRVSQQVISLVKSSNFHSGSGDKYRIFTFAGVQQDYRDAIATGEYLVLILSPAHKIITREGEVTAAEIVVGLQSPNSKNTVFTIDESGAIVSHAKYSYEILMALKKSVAEERLILSP